MADTKAKAKADSGAELTAKELKEKKLLEKENGKGAATNGKENEENGEPELDEDDEEEVDEEDEEDEGEGDEEDDEDDDDDVEGGTKRAAEDDDDDDEDDVETKKQKTDDDDWCVFLLPAILLNPLPGSSSLTFFPIVQRWRGWRTESKNKQKKEEKKV